MAVEEDIRNRLLDVVKAFQPVGTHILPFDPTEAKFLLVPNTSPAHMKTWTVEIGDEQGANFITPDVAGHEMAGEYFDLFMHTVRFYVSRNQSTWQEFRNSMVDMYRELYRHMALLNPDNTLATFDRWRHPMWQIGIPVRLDQYPIYFGAISVGYRQWFSVDYA